MVIGICRIDLSLPGNHSLKGKRSIIRRIVDRTSNRFNVAVAEVGELDDLQHGALGLAVVSNDTRHVNSMIDGIVSFVDELGDAFVVARDMEMVHFGRDMHGAGEGADWDDFAADDESR